jgi:PHD/YefM family antitoxin component YafN of YafNO toxin-antitoxin module
MKTVNLEQTTLDACVDDAQQEYLVITRNGKPVALMVGVEGLDEEQLQLGSSEKFWQLITERREQYTVSRDKLEQALHDQNTKSQS